MRKQYIKPECTDVTAALGTDILEGVTIAGQSKNPVDGRDDSRDNTEFSKKSMFEQFEEDDWADHRNIWED